MIIIIPLILFIVSTIIFLKLKDTNEASGGFVLTSVMFSGTSLMVAVTFFMLEYSTYVNSLATIEYCKESIDNKTLELDETITINKTDEIYENKFSKVATHTKNNDTPIASTQEYLKDIQESRLQERERCLRAKRDVLSFKLGFFGMFAHNPN